MVISTRLMNFAQVTIAFILIINAQNYHSILIQTDVDYSTKTQKNPKRLNKIKKQKHVSKGIDEVYICRGVISFFTFYQLASLTWNHINTFSKIVIC